MRFLFGIDFDLTALFFFQKARIGNKAEELYSEATENTEMILFTF